MWFSLHRTAHLFPLVNSENDSVSTPVISAALGGHRVEDLEEPLRITLRLLDQVCGGEREDVCVREREWGGEREHSPYK